MEALFTVTCIYDEALYKKFAYTYYKKGSKIIIPTIIISVCSVLLGLLFWTKYHELFYLILFVAIGVIFPIILKLRIDSMIHKTWASSKLMQNIENTVAFYEDHVEQSNSIGNMKVDYKNLFRILEDNYGIYLMISKAQGICIKKEACSPELIDFIKNISIN